MALSPRMDPKRSHKSKTQRRVVINSAKYIFERRRGDGTLE